MGAVVQLRRGQPARPIGLPVRPLPIDILAALTEASRLLAGPLDQSTASLTMDRARKIGAAAMAEAFPRMKWEEIATAIGGFDRNPQPLAFTVSEAMRADWWRDDIVEEVVGVFVGRYLPEDV